MNYKIIRNCCFVLSIVIFFSLIAFIFTHNYDLWKNEGPKFSEENYTFIELLFARQKVALLFTGVATLIPLLLTIFFHKKYKQI